MSKQIETRRRRKLEIDIEGKYIDAMRSKGYNITEIVNAILKHVLSYEGDELAYEIKRTELEIQLKEVNHNLKKHSDIVRIAKKRKAFIEKKLKELGEYQADLDQRKEYAKLISKLNSIIILSEYDIKVVSVVARDVIEEIKTHDEYFDLETHINTFKFI